MFDSRCPDQFEAIVTDNVIYLHFRSPHLEEGVLSFFACIVCRNKTYTLRDDGKDYPLMTCAACGQHMGRMGWIKDDDEPTPEKSA